MNSTQHEQFAKAFILFQDRIYGYITTILPNRHDAEDVFQQTSLVIWQKWEQFDQNRDFVRWACGIAHNEVRNFYRRRSRHRVSFSDKLLDELADLRLQSQPMLEERRRLLSECLKKLDFVAREWFQRCYADKESIGAIAHRFHITSNAVYLRLSRIRRELVECVNREMGKEDSP